MEQFDRVRGYFEPKVIGTLRTEAKEFVGQLLVFECLWLIDKDDGGPYIGQWAMRPCDKHGEWLLIGWVPEEDVRIVSYEV